MPTTYMTDTGPIAVIRPRATRADITENELAWIGFLREISGWSDPSPSLRAVQQLRHALGGGGKEPADGHSPTMATEATSS